jgi:hypothetical protein
MRTRTVFVLGAGARAPFGFPCGPAWSQKIYQETDKQFHLTIPDILNHCGFSDSKLAQFRSEFYRSGSPSIDSFLEHRSDYMDIGKAVIAATLIPYERDEIFKYADDNWLRYAFGELNSGFDEFSENKLSIITFNYDRVVEHFLLSALRYLYGKSIENCVQVLRPLGEAKIVNCRDFNNSLNHDAIRSCVNEIHIIPEDVADRNREFNRAKQLLNEAEKIYFLGFGFNQVNVERLGVATLAPKKSIATGYGLRPREIADIVSMTDGRVRIVDSDCINLCRNEIDWS